MIALRATNGRDVLDGISGDMFTVISQTPESISIEPRPGTPGHLVAALVAEQTGRKVQYVFKGKTIEIQPSDADAVLSRPVG